jgi:adenosine deaminase
VSVLEPFGSDDTVLAQFARAAVDASFAPAATKARLRQEIAAWLAAPAD